MVKVYLIACLLLSIWQVSLAQNSPQSNQNKQEKILKSLEKKIRKSPEDPLPKYQLALFLLGNKQMDTSYQLINRAIEDYKNQSGKDLSKLNKKLQKEGLSIDSLLTHRNLLDSLAFEHVQREATIRAFEKFIFIHQVAKQKPLAIAIRDSLAFRRVQQIDTYEAYVEFLEKYPQSKQAQNAVYFKKIFELDKQCTLKSIVCYENYLLDYPDTPIREEVEYRILQLLVAGHHLETLESFVEAYPHGAAKQRALDWIKFFYEQEGQLTQFLKKYPDYHAHQEIEHLCKVEAKVVFPVLKDKKFGFLNYDGHEITSPRYDSLPENYFCSSPIETEWLKVSIDGQMGAIQKNGKPILPIRFDNIEEFENNLLLTEHSQQLGLAHLAGFEIFSPQFEEIDFLQESFLKVKQEGKYALAALNGNLYTHSEFDDIQEVGSKMIAFQKENGWAVWNKEKIFENIKNGEAIEVDSFFCDSLYTLEKHWIVVKKDQKFGIIKDEHPVLPIKFDSLKKVATGWIAHLRDSVQIFNFQGKRLVPYCQDAFANAYYYAVKINDKWGVLSWEGKIVLPALQDSVILLNQWVLSLKNKQWQLELPSTKIKIKPVKKAQVLSYSHLDEKYWILTENKQGKKGLYSQAGKLVLAEKFDDIRFLSSEYISLQKEDKYGLLSANTYQLILPFVYDGIGATSEHNHFSLLDNFKFGVWEAEQNHLIKPAYEAVPRVFSRKNKQWLVKIKDQLNLIDSTGALLLPGSFEKILPWQDSIILAKQDTSWRLIDLSNPDSLWASWQEVQLLYDQAILNTENREFYIKAGNHGKLGVWSNVKGEVVPPIYKYIRNVGAPIYPVFLCELPYSSSSSNPITEVHYLNAEGKLIRKYITLDKDLARLECLVSP